MALRAEIAAARVVGTNFLACESLIMTPPTSLVIFGGGGDLTWRKLIPALYNLFLEQSLAERFRILGVDRQDQGNDAYLKHLREGVDQFSRRGRTRDEEWKSFAALVAYARADLMDAGAYQ